MWSEGEGGMEQSRWAEARREGAGSLGHDSCLDPSRAAAM